MKTIFVASAKSAPPEETDACIARFKAAFPKGDFEFARSGEVFEKHFRRIGGWSQWSRFVVHGARYGENEPMHNGFLVPTLTIGKATAEIVNTALAAKRTVMVEVEPGTFRKAVGVVQVSDSWKDGWLVKV